MTALLWLAAAHAQQYGFPTSAADYPEFYPTAYYDHGGTTDWNCDSLTYSGHRGSDFGGGSWPGMDAGRDIVAAAPGVVSATHDGEFDRCYTGTCYGGGGFGNYVYIQHGNGRKTIYAHMKQWSVQVAVGDEVDCGTKLGEMGSSGYSTGPHLHFQVQDLADSAEDPFEGACDPGVSLWEDQGVWDDLPVLDCDSSWPGCPDVDRVGCGAVIDARNDDPGSTGDHWYWGCTDFVYSGPEIGWRFATDLDEPVTVRVTGLTADLDLFAVGDDLCDGRACQAASTNSNVNDEEIVFDAVAGVEYAIAVDGWEGATSGFRLEILCNGALPGSGTTGGTDPGGSGTGGTATGSGGTGTGGATGGSGTGTGSSPRVEPGSKSMGCGCDTGSAPAWAWVLLLPIAGIRRRTG